MHRTSVNNSRSIHFITGQLSMCAYLPGCRSDWFERWNAKWQIGTKYSFHSDADGSNCTSIACRKPSTLFGKQPTVLISSQNAIFQTRLLFSNFLFFIWFFICADLILNAIRSKGVRYLVDFNLDFVERFEEVRVDAHANGQTGECIALHSIGSSRLTASSKYFSGSEFPSNEEKPFRSTIRYF